MKALHVIVWILLIIGGLNWLVYALSGMTNDILDYIGLSSLASVIYILIGLAAVVDLFTHRKACRHCSAGM